MDENTSRCNRTDIDCRRVVEYIPYVSGAGEEPEEGGRGCLLCIEHCSLGATSDEGSGSRAVWDHSSLGGNVRGGEWDESSFGQPVTSSLFI